MSASSGSPRNVLVSIVTPSIPERAHFLAELEASVQAQTLEADHEHIILVDVDRDGNAVTTNRAALLANGKWLLPIADDDLLLPGALKTLLAAAEECGRDGFPADVVYSPPLVTGNEDRWWFFQEPPVIPAVALIRTDLWSELGGYDESLGREEDRDLWTRALAAGARFARVDDPCWVYRQHAGNKSFNAGVAA